MVGLNIHNTPASGKSSWIPLEENQRSKCGQGKVGEIVDLGGIKILWDDDATQWLLYWQYHPFSKNERNQKKRKNWQWWLIKIQLLLKFFEIHTMLLRVLWDPCNINNISICSLILAHIMSSMPLDLLLVTFNTILNIKLFEWKIETN